MSVLLAGSAAAAYAVTVVGAWRFYVWRQRAQSGGFKALDRLDWGALLEELLPTSPGTLEGVPPLLPSGEPTPKLLFRPPAPGAERRRAAILELLCGRELDPDDPALAQAGFTGGELRLLGTLSRVRARPAEALDRLESATPASAAEVYLREHLRLSFRANLFNREVAVFAAKRRVAAALSRFGDAACLYFIRARASALAGMNRAAIDDLARAVYYSRQDPFYVRAVLDSAYVAQARPALVFQCRQALDPARNPGERGA